MATPEAPDITSRDDDNVMTIVSLGDNNELQEEAEPGFVDELCTELAQEGTNTIVTVSDGQTDDLENVIFYSSD